MKLKMLNLELPLPAQVHLKDLRQWIRGEIFNHGEPLRWAITSVERPSQKGTGKLKLEAVVIISKATESEDRSS